ncbi:hypothetical protein IM40_09635 (plasmid) [Candidatus Paracaedimonas acanthamoebae]|nr:hypothetical protein IM40_09635 [Candidatus Paracaedimonas acanthamoebae]
MRIMASVQFLLLLFINSFAFASVTEEQAKPYMKVTAHNVGQGSCTTAELYSPEYEEPIYVLIDAGSSAYKKELFCQEYFMRKAEKMVLEESLKEGEKEVIPSSPLPSSSSSSSTIPQSILRHPSPGESQAFRRSQKGSSYEEVKQKIINNIRRSLGTDDPEKAINILTFFISHPDSDHYNLAKDIFKNDKDKVHNIILGGLPEKYSLSFRNWLQKQIDKKETRVYFPALLTQQPIVLIDDLVSESLADTCTCTYAPQMFSDPEEGWKPKEHLKDFEQALPLGPHIKTYLLSVNPTHWQEGGKERVQRSCLEDDDNSDSLVLKLQIGENKEEKSIIITGDATNITTDRILGNYEDNLDFLKCTILTADHHGAKTHGSNNLRWIKATAPQHVIFSCGTMHGHPSLQAYKNFKQSSAFAETEAHDIWVWQVSDKKEDNALESQSKGRKAIVHKTYHSLFSTFNSGTLSFTLPMPGEIKLESQLLNLKSKELNPKREYTISKEEEKELASLEEEVKEIILEEEEIENLEQSFSLESFQQAAAPQSSTLSPYQEPRHRAKSRKRLEKVKGTKRELEKGSDSASTLSSERKGKDTLKTARVSKKLRLEEEETREKPEKASEKKPARKKGTKRLRVRGKKDKND